MKTIRVLLFATLFASVSTLLSAQQSGSVNYPELGLSFDIPQGWVGQERGDIYLMGSHELPGLIILIPNEVSSFEQMRQEAYAGFQEGTQTNLQLSSPLKSINSSILGANFSGTLDGQVVEAYVCGILNPFGTRVTVMAVSLKDQFTAKHQEAAKTVARSFDFYQAKGQTAQAQNQGDKVMKWTRSLSIVY